MPVTVYPENAKAGGFWDLPKTEGLPKKRLIGAFQWTG